MNQLDYVISFFQLYLMFHACVRKFDVTNTMQIFFELNRALASPGRQSIIDRCVHFREVLAPVTRDEPSRAGREEQSAFSSGMHCPGGQSTRPDSRKATRRWAPSIDDRV